MPRLFFSGIAASSLEKSSGLLDESNRKMADPKSKLSTLGKRLFELKLRRDALELELKATNSAIEKLATKDLANIMEHSEIDDFHVRDYGTIMLRSDFYANVLKDNRPKLYAWLRKNGAGDLIQDWVFPGTLKSFVREQFDKGLPTPSMVDVRFIPTVHTLAAKKTPAKYPKLKKKKK